MNARIIFFFFFLLPLSYNAHPSLAVHFSKEAKNFGYSSTNGVLLLHFMVLKITIQLFRTINNNALIIFNEPSPTYNPRFFIHVFVGLFCPLFYFHKLIRYMALKRNNINYVALFQLSCQHIYQFLYKHLCDIVQLVKILVRFLHST